MDCLVTIRGFQVSTPAPLSDDLLGRRVPWPALPSKPMSHLEQRRVRRNGRVRWVFREEFSGVGEILETWKAGNLGMGPGFHIFSFPLCPTPPASI